MKPDETIAHCSRCGYERCPKCGRKRRPQLPFIRFVEILLVLILFLLVITNLDRNDHLVQIADRLSAIEAAVREGRR